MHPTNLAQKILSFIVDEENRIHGLPQGKDSPLDLCSIS